MRAIEVYFLPELTSAESLVGKTVVVIDVLRATTSIVHALAAGAHEVFACETIEEARALAATTPGAVLGGERHGLRIEGFDFGNSPAEYSPTTVLGKTLFFTTTNGTRAMRHGRLARRIYLAAFANFSAVCDALAADADAREIVILCAGTNREVTREDVLLAGAIVDELFRISTGGEAMARLNDQACIAADAWRAATRDLSGAAPLGETLRNSRGGRNLIELGLERDIAIAAEIDRFAMAPIVDPSTWRITA